jgi:hypothetical protein
MNATSTYTLGTATGSMGPWSYGAYRLVNDGTETQYDFMDQAFPEPREQQFRSGNTMMTELTYDPLMLVRTESRPYDQEAVVLKSAERAYLRNLRRKQRKLVDQTA